uniref:Uncharacterized protein n=1 Tax=Setaria viridis TaxID=4556 RepID=A0A4U6UHC3_SETVI|nr:hypothetical protein SEVIR_5G190600v2 [Setaria viridis]
MAGDGEGEDRAGLVLKRASDTCVPASASSSPRRADPRQLPSCWFGPDLWRPHPLLCTAVSTSGGANGGPKSSPSSARRCPLSALDVQLELPQMSTSVSQAHPPTRTALQGAISGFLSAHLRWRTRRVQQDGPWPPATKARKN